MATNATKSLTQKVHVLAEAIARETAVLPETTCAYITTACRDDIKVLHKWRKTADALMADGINSDMLVKTPKGETNPNQALHDQIERAIKASFDEDVQLLLVKEPKSLSQVSKGVRSYWIKQVSSYFNKIRQHLKKLEEDGADKSRVTKTKKERIQAHIKNALDLVKSFENPDFNATALAKVLTDAQAIIK